MSARSYALHSVCPQFFFFQAVRVTRSLLYCHFYTHLHSAAVCSHAVPTAKIGLVRLWVALLINVASRALPVMMSVCQTPQISPSFLRQSACIIRLAGLSEVRVSKR